MPIAKKVRDLLVPLSEYAVTRTHNTLREAVPTLRKLYCQVEEGKCTQAGHRSILVLDDDGRLVGILKFRNILRTLIPELAGGLTARLESLGVTIAFAQADAVDLDEAKAGFRARVIKNAEVKVQDIMLPVKGVIQADADLMDALKLMYRNNITVAPVYDGEELVGVIRESDLFLTVAVALEE
jgi:CBS domain-containing protein